MFSFIHSFNGQSKAERTGAPLRQTATSIFKAALRLCCSVQVNLELRRGQTTETGQNGEQNKDVFRTYSDCEDSAD